MNSDLPASHWLIVPALGVIGAVGGVILRGVPMAVNWWLKRADAEGPMWFPNITADDS